MLNRTFQVLFWITAIVLGTSIGCNYGLSLGLVAFFSPLIVYEMIVLLIFWPYLVIAPYLPIWWQRPAYLLWKSEVKKISKEVDEPLLLFPLAVYISENLDKNYEKGGIALAREELNAWIAKWRNKIEGETYAK